MLRTKISASFDYILSIAAVEVDSLMQFLSETTELDMSGLSSTPVLMYIAKVLGLILLSVRILNLFEQWRSRRNTNEILKEKEEEIRSRASSKLKLEEQKKKSEFLQSLLDKKESADSKEGKNKS